MASSKLLKERIESIQDTRKITNAMYLISSSKLRKARKNYQNVLPYFTRMRDTISRVVPHLPDEPVHPTIQIGRAVQQECRDRSRMPSSA